MANFYLDKAGLERLWGHIVALVNEATAGGSGTDNEGNIISETYLKLTGGTVSGEVNSSTEVATSSAAFRNIKVIAPGTEIVPGITAIPTGELWVRYEE